MLTSDERAEIDHEIAQWGELRARCACIGALRIAQERRGWISEETIADVAALLGMSSAEVDSVATFYSLLFRRPVGRHVLLLCDSAPCWIMGYEQVRVHLEQRLGITFGQTTRDGEFTLLPVPCLGACDRAPVLMLDDELSEGLDPAKIDEVLASARVRSSRARGDGRFAEGELWPSGARGEDEA